MTRSEISLLLVLIRMVPVVGYSQEVLFDSTGVYIRCCLPGGGGWAAYELIIQGNTIIGDSVFAVTHFEPRFPSLDSLDLIISHNAYRPVLAELSQESTLQSITYERADSLSHFEFSIFFLIKGYSKNDAQMAIKNQVDVEIILYGIMYPILNKHDSTECIGQKREWSRIVSVPVVSIWPEREQRYLKYTPINEK